LAWPATIPEEKVDEVRDLLGFVVDDSRTAGLLDTLARRKLLLACLLLRNPSVLLLDEPCSGLLAGEIDQMGTIIRRIRSEIAAAVVVVEHRLELLAAIADRVMVMDRGKVIVQGPPAEAFADPAVQRAYFTGPRSAA
jgi:ABC-type branched-subunit amino acid transport system ATPase component